MRWTAEGAARSHFEIRSGATGARAMRYEGDSGVVYQARCACGSDRRRMDWTQADLRKAASCWGCGGAWPSDLVVESSHGSSPSTAPGRYSMFDMVIDLTRVMIESERAHIWGFRAFYLFHGERVGGERKVAERARELWPRASVTWNRDNVRALRHEGRLVVESALDARGILLRPAVKIRRPEDAYVDAPFGENA